jgi:hypothetical protein
MFGESYTLDVTTFLEVMNHDERHDGRNVDLVSLGSASYYFHRFCHFKDDEEIVEKLQGINLIETVLPYLICFPL